MTTRQTQLECASEVLINLLGEQYKWRWEDSRHALLSEFSRDKKDTALEILQQYFPDLWDTKTIKKAPKSLKEELGQLSKLSKQQLLFTRPTNGDDDALLAIWWPWGHGGTYSLRLVMLENSYQLSSTNKSKDNVIILMLKKFGLMK